MFVTASSDWITLLAIVGALSVIATVVIRRQRRAPRGRQHSNSHDGSYAHYASGGGEAPSRSRKPDPSQSSDCNDDEGGGGSDGGGSDGGGGD